MQIRAERQHTSLSIALRIIDDAWEELRRSPLVQRQLGVTPTRLPDVSFAEAQRRSAVGHSLLKRLEVLDQSELPHDIALTLRLVRFRAVTWSREAEWYWIVSDPLGAGSPGMFLPTAYCGGFVLHMVQEQLASFHFTDAGDADRYLSLVADHARLIDQFAERTAGQAERGIRMPRAQVQQARALLAAFKSGVRKAVGVAAQRQSVVHSDGFSRELESRLATRIEPAFDRALGGLSDAYLAKAPDAVGLGQYPGGVEVYAALVKLHTTMDLTPEQVHDTGNARMAQIETSMQGIRAELGFEGDGAAFLRHLEQDPRWRADTVEGVTAVFQRYIDRLKPRFKDYFSIAPKAAYGIAPLPEALQGSMTFGYYDAPTRDHAEGIYLFNPANLTKRALISVGTLTYHELMPGHHLHVATQRENEALHPFRTHFWASAYNEGWAEYAATLAEEIGLYEQPAERYGRLVMDAFLTCRLVVDTGMNVLGWSFERARDYLRKHSGMTEKEIHTELIRYSCDIPGQALAYKLGDTQMLALRERVRRALGARFSLKDFHAAVLAPGALPLSELEWHIEHEIERLKERE